MTKAFFVVFACALIVNVIATLQSSIRKAFWGKASSEDEEDENDEGRTSKNFLDEERRQNAETIKNYLLVYLLAVFSDWVKGPYAYELYSSGDYYNYDSREIYVLCSVLPFVSSVVFGTFLCGPIADRGFNLRCGGGRKKMALVFALVTALSNITKHFRDVKASIVGAVLEGISTSLLFTGFDSCLVESFLSNDTEKISSSSALHLSRVLATAEYRNNIVAISAGWIATQVVEMTDFRPLLETTKEIENSREQYNAVLYVGGVLNPFDLSSFALLLCAIFIHIFWDEKQGEKSQQEKEKRPNQQLYAEGSSTWWQRYRSSLADAFVTAINSKEILFTGLVCFLFESAMFIFIFSWTNSIASRLEEQQQIPFSLVFATFMFGCMTGTSIFTVLTDELRLKNEAIGKALLFAATCAFLGMAFANSIISSMIAFFSFEVSVGVYFPMMGTMKSQIVPEEHRTTIYNMYRIPFNVIMVVFLFWSGAPSSLLSLYPKLPFVICACTVGTAFFLQQHICKHQEGRNGAPSLATKPSKPDLFDQQETLQQKKFN